MGCLWLAPGRAITLIDDDRVDISSLHRQLAFRETDLGQQNPALARQLCAQPGRCSRVLWFGTDSERDEASLKGVDLVLDATDNPRRVTILGRRPTPEIAV